MPVSPANRLPLNIVNPGRRIDSVCASPDEPPKLVVIVDTEEEFDWSKPHSRDQISVGHIKHHHRTQSIFERYGVRPTYVVDFPVASQEAGYRVLREWLEDGKCQIGAHLHPWVNPPFDEPLSARNSFPGNLPAELERKKLAVLTDTVEANFGIRPTVYRAGRYGIGANTGGILEALGYEVDSSVVPYTNFAPDAGPDFMDFDASPFWFGPTNSVLEIPLTVEWHGRLRRYGADYQRYLMSKLGLKLHLPGILARLHLSERIRLTPEGTTLAELKRLVDTMLETGHRHFVFSFHSPSVAPGNTPYVRSDEELRRFLTLIDEFCAYFFGERGGEATTPTDLRRDWERHRSSARAKAGDAIG